MTGAFFHIKGDCMLIIERFFRRIAYSFGVAGLLTVGFQDSLSYFQIPLLTYIVTAVLFIFSWRIQKEYKEIILKIDGPDAQDPAKSWFGNLYERSPHQYHILWEGFYTFGAVLIAIIAAENFGYYSYNKIGYILGLTAVILFVITRAVDPRAKRRYYEKG